MGRFTWRLQLGCLCPTGFHLNMLAIDVVVLSWLTHLCNIARRSGLVPLDCQSKVVVEEESFS